MAKETYTNPNPLEYITKDASAIRELLNPQFMAGLNVSLAEAVLEPQASTLKHQHTDFDEIYYCLEGEGKLFINDQLFNLKPGSFYLLPKMSSHYLIASTRLRILCICNPPYNHQQTIILP